MEFAFSNLRKVTRYPVVYKPSNIHKRRENKHSRVSNTGYNVIVSVSNGTANEKTAPWVQGVYHGSFHGVANKRNWTGYSTMDYYTSNIICLHIRC